MATGWEHLAELDAAAGRDELTPEGHAALEELRTAGLSGGLTGTPPEGVRRPPPAVDTTGTIVKGVGAALGAAPGVLTGNPLLAASGGAAGYGIAGTGLDLVRGTGDPARGLLQAGANLALQASPIGEGLSLGKAVVGAGLTSALAGKFYDLAKEFVTGRHPTFTEAATSTGADVVAGALGEASARELHAQAAPRRDARAAAQVAQEGRRQDFADAGITPKASEIAASPTLAQVEAVPARLPIGRGGPDRFAARRAGEVRGAVQKIEKGISPTGVTDDLWAGSLVQPALWEAQDQFHADKRVAFEAVNAITGPDPVVPTTNVVGTAKSILGLRTQTPLNAPGAAGKLAKLGDSAMAWEQYAGKLKDLGLSDESTMALEQAEQEGKIPFWLSRKLESELGAAGNWARSQGTGGRYLDVQRLYRAVRDDQDLFFDTDAGEDVRPALQEAKQLFKTHLRTFDETKVRAMLEHSEPERIVRLAFTPGNVSATLDLKQHVPADVFAQGVQGTLHGIYEKAGGDEAFSPVKFATALNKYPRAQLEAMVGVETADQLQQLATVFHTVRDTGLPGVKPSGPGQAVGSMGQLSSIPAAIIEFLSGHPLAATGVATATLGTPAALGALTTRPAGIDFLARQALPRGGMGLPGREFVGQIAGQGAAAPMGNAFMDWLRQQGAGPTP